jgi:hypothetical protein
MEAKLLAELKAKEQQKNAQSVVSSQEETKRRESDSSS